LGPCADLLAGFRKFTPPGRIIIFAIGFLPQKGSWFRGTEAAGIGGGSNLVFFSLVSCRPAEPRLKSKKQNSKDMNQGGGAGGHRTVGRASKGQRFTACRKEKQKGAVVRLKSTQNVVLSKAVGALISGGQTKSSSAGTARSGGEARLPSTMAEFFFVSCTHISFASNILVKRAMGADDRGWKKKKNLKFSVVHHPWRPRFSWKFGQPWDRIGLLTAEGSIRGNVLWCGREKTP